MDTFIFNLPSFENLKWYQTFRTPLGVTALRFSKEGAFKSCCTGNTTLGCVQHRRLRHRHTEGSPRFKRKRVWRMWSQPLLDKDHAGSMTSLPHICERSLTTLNLLFRVSFQVWLNMHAKVYHIDLLRSFGGILPVCRHWVDMGGGHCLPTHSLEFSQSWPVLLLPPVYVKFLNKGYFTCIPRRHRLLMTQIQNLIRRFRSSCLVAISQHFLNVHVYMTKLLVLGQTILGVY